MRGDRELLEAWAGGDETAGRDFFRRYAERVTRFFARKLGDDVTDLVQRTFLRCLERARRKDAIRDPGAMLFAIARNLLCDAFRAQMRDEARFDPGVTSLADLRTDPPEHIARHEQQRLLLRALRMLPLDDQIAIELYYWEEMSMEQVGETLGITRSAALSRIHRARTDLRRRIGKLEAAPAILSDTIEGLESWARSLRQHAATPSE